MDITEQDYIKMIEEMEDYFCVALHGKTTQINNYLAVPGIESFSEEKVIVLFRKNDAAKEELAYLIEDAAYTIRNLYFSGRKKDNYILYTGD